MNGLDRSSVVDKKRYQSYYCRVKIFLPIIYWVFSSFFISLIQILETKLIFCVVSTALRHSPSKRKSFNERHKSLTDTSIREVDTAETTDSENGLSLIVYFLLYLSVNRFVISECIYPLWHLVCMYLC